ncbi:MAG: glycosyltransferase family 87 protein [Rickettsiales bacterium]
MSLRDGAWVTRARIHTYCLMLLLMSVGVYGYLAFSAHGLVDARGEPLGTDFSAIYAAGLLAQAGTPNAGFTLDALHAVQQHLFGPQVGAYGWYYPPVFLLLALGLSYLPYLAALVLWQGASLVLYVRSVAEILPWRQALLPALAYPAVFINLGHGQNGLLSAALLGAGLVLLRGRPVVAGVLLGMLCYKPQFGLLIPLALVAGAHWRAMFAATLTVLALCACATLMFGAEVWEAFAGALQFSRENVLEQGGGDFYKIQSVFAAVRLWGGGVAFAYAVQLGVTLGLAKTLWSFWRSPAADALKYAALIIATVLATPYSFDYDLTLLAPAIALLVQHGLRNGFAAYEKSLLAVVFISPLFLRSIAEYAHVPLGAVLMGLLYWNTVRRSVKQLKNITENH